MSSNSSSLQVSQPNSSSLAPEQHSLFPLAQIDSQKIGCHESNSKTTRLKVQSTGCWNFLQQDTKNTSGDLSKIPTLWLTATSLEMCTEILGCETGCPILNKSVQTSHERQYSCNIKPSKAREMHDNNFPPPLTSISDGGGVRVQANRGGGRLVITSTTGGVYFKSERENGRLRLFFHKECDYRESEQEFSGGIIGCNFKCGDGSGSKNLTSLPVCVAFS